MKTHYLFPAIFRKIGWLLFVPSLATAALLRATGFQFEDAIPARVFALYDSGILSDPQAFRMISNPIADEILLTLIIAGGILAGFSRLPNEDEMTQSIRYESLVWAVYANFAIMLLATWFLYGSIYFDVLIANMFTVLFFFLIRFQVMLYRVSKTDGV